MTSPAEAALREAFKDIANEIAADAWESDYDEDRSTKAFMRDDRVRAALAAMEQEPSTEPIPISGESVGLRDKAVDVLNDFADHVYEHAQGIEDEPAYAEDYADRILDFFRAAPDKIARAFHEGYQRLALQSQFRTRDEIAVPWDDVPKRDRELMVAMVNEVLAEPKRLDRVALGKPEGGITGWTVNSSTVPDLVYFSTRKRWENALPAILMDSTSKSERPEPVAYEHRFSCGHSVFTKQSNWDGTRYVCEWSDGGTYTGTRALVPTSTEAEP